MGCEARYFSQKGVTLYYIVNYFQQNERFSNVRAMFANKEVSGGFICFHDNEDNENHSVWAYLYDYDVEDEDTDKPVLPIKNESVQVSVRSDDYGIQLMTDMAKTLGGYANDNDCGDTDAPDFWKQYEGNNIVHNEIADKLFVMLDTDRERQVKNIPSALDLVDFVIRHLDEIKNL